ncbi:MAG: hypothetical protein LBJ83_02120 [Oscillospiraceae bacterium]|nr:hypothetical protein [Oscillospiraceae bacterium]
MPIFYQFSPIDWQTNRNPASKCPNGGITTPNAEPETSTPTQDPHEMLPSLDG